MNMNRTTARMIIRRVLVAQLLQRKASRGKRATLPTGNVLIGLDMLARAQFLEGLAGKTFNSVSAPAGSGKAMAQKVILKLLHVIDPTLDISEDNGVFKDPTVIVWAGDFGASGLYKAAWLGANRALGRTRGPSGSGTEPGDILTANMLRYIEAEGGEKLPENEAEEIGETANLEEKMEVFESQEKAIKDEALNEAASAGNFFWMAGKNAQSQKEGILTGRVTVDRLGGIVARYAFNAASNFVDKMETESRALARALKIQMLPGAGEDRADFDLGELTPTGWGYVIQAVLADPISDFSGQVFQWMKDDVKYSDLTDREQMVMGAYIDAVIDGRLTDLQTDMGFVQDFNDRNPDAKISANYLKVTKNKYLGKDGADIAKRLMKDAPQWKLDAEDYLFLMNAQRGRGKFAAQHRTAAERALRSQIIRLAHANPSLRPHILPLLKRSADEGLEAGRTWGGPGAGRDWDWNKPEYAKHEDSPPAGADGSAARKRYNKWYRENVCPDKHGTGCGL